MTIRVLTKAAYTVEEFAAVQPIGRTSLYRAIKAKKLRARKYGRSTIILAADAQAFLENLPAIERE
jgi:excisionase family DNA binding protein